MVFKRSDRPNEGYRVWVTLPEPWGRVGPWQTGMRDQRQAQRVEKWLYETALTEPRLIDGIIAKRFTLRTAWVANLRGQLDALLEGISDPLLSDAIEQYRPDCSDARELTGLDQLLEYADVGVRLSWLTGKNIRGIYRKAVGAGRKPNSVKRSLHRAVSGLLAYHLEEEGQRRALRGVVAPNARDERLVSVTAEEIRSLVDHCEPDGFRWLVVAAIATAVDQGPLLAMTPRDVHELEGTVAIPDAKTPHRPRILKLSDVALLAFRLAAQGKASDEPLWPWTRGQVRNLWESARDETAGRPHRGQRKYWGKDRKKVEPIADPIGDRAKELLEARALVTLPILRFKDLRHLLPTLLASMGKDRREIQELLGHAPGSRQTDRYITPVGDVSVLNDAAAKLGLAGVNLRAVGE